MRYEKINNLKVFGVLGICILLVYIVTASIANKNSNSIELIAGDRRGIIELSNDDESIDQTFMKIWNEHKNNELFRQTREKLVLELKNEIDKTSCPSCPKCSTQPPSPSLEQLAHKEPCHIFSTLSTFF